MKQNPIALMCLLPLLALTAPTAEAQSTQKMCEVRDHRGGKTVVRKVPCRNTTTPPRTTKPPPRRTGGTTIPPHSTERTNTVVPARRGTARDPADRGTHPDPASLLKEENWIGRYKVAPVQLSSARDPHTGSLKSITTVLADDVELRDRSYQMKRGTSPRNVLLIADRIRISGPVVFDLPGWNQGENKRGGDLIDRSGGDLVLLVRTLECGPNGRLELRAAGGTGPHGAGHGGDLIVAAERFLIGDRVETWERAVEAGCLRLTAPGGTAGPGVPVATAGQIRAFNSVAEAVAALEKGPTKDYDWRNYLPAVSRWALHASSKWVLDSLSKAIADVRAADVTAGNIEALRRLRPALELANVELYPVRPEDLPAYEERLVKLQELRDRFASGLWHDTLAVDSPGGVRRRLELFTEGRDLRARLAPTEALLRTRLADGRRVLGLIEFDPEQPDLLQLELEVQLTVDPWLASLAARDLAARGEEYGGAFGNWTLVPLPLSGHGIRDSQVEVSPSGDGARVLLSVEADQASLVMSRLASSSGLPLDFSWEYRDDRNLSGQWRGPALSLLRRADPGLAVGAAGTLTNRAGIEVTVEYLEIDGEYHALDPAVSLAPGQSASLSLPAGADAAGLRVPPEAVVYTGMDPFRFDSDFKIVNGEELIERFAITNLLGYDELRGGALDYVEVELAYGVGEASAALAGPYRLAPFGAEGSEIRFSFVKSQRGGRQLVLSGAAYYEGGGCQTLTPTTFDELSVKITENMLPSLDGEPAGSPSRCRAGT